MVDECGNMWIDEVVYKEFNRLKNVIFKYKYKKQCHHKNNHNGTSSRLCLKIYVDVILLINIKNIIDYINFKILRAECMIVSRIKFWEHILFSKI